jgi:hypothetical protein
MSFLLCINNVQVILTNQMLQSLVFSIITNQAMQGSSMSPIMLYILTTHLIKHGHDI